MVSGPITSWQIEGEKVEAVTDFIFLMVTAAMKLKDLLLGRKALTNLGQHIKKQRYHFSNKGSYSQNYSFSRSHVQM